MCEFHVRTLFQSSTPLETKKKWPPTPNQEDKNPAHQQQQMMTKSTKQVPHQQQKIKFMINIKEPLY